MIRILLVDDHTMVCEALRLVLEQDPDVQVVGVASTGEAALPLARQLQPDVVVMDIALPGMSGIAATQHLLAEQPGLKVLGLSTYLDRRIIGQMLAVGARGFIVKSAAGTELKRGVHSLVQGHDYLCGEVSALLAQAPPASSGLNKAQALSRREVQVLTLLAEGQSTPEIAEHLFISANTVDVHRRNLMHKLDIHNVVDLTRYAIRVGLVSA